MKLSIRPNILRQPFRPSISLRKPLQPPLSSHISRLNASTSSPASTQQQRLTRILSRLPRPLHPYVSRLQSAPLSHIISFLILHEITAVLPLLGLAGAFHYWNWVPDPGRWLDEGYVEKFGRYFGRKGWFGFEKGEKIDMKGIVDGEEGVEVERSGSGSERGRGMRILVEVATAYAITKVLLPVRVVVSVWATPWFARVVVGRFGGLFGKKAGGNVVRSGAAGTGATGGGVIGSGK